MMSRPRSFAYIVSLLIASASALRIDRPSVIDEPGFNGVEESEISTLRITPAEYEHMCGVKSDTKHPCFTHWRGSLASVHVAPFLEPITDITHEILIKDEHGLDFSVWNASVSYMITYIGMGKVQFVYSNYDKATGCYDISLRRGRKHAWRIWFSDDKGNDRDLDTRHHDFTSGRFCTKWGHIHVDYSYWADWRFY